MRGDFRFVVVSVTNGVQDLAPALAGYRARLMALAIVNTNTPGLLTVYSGVVPVTGDMSLIAGGVFVLPFSIAGWAQTATGAALRIGIAGVVTGCAVYEYVPDV